MTGVDRFIQRGTASTLLSALLLTGCVGTDVVMELLPGDSDGTAEDETNDNDNRHTDDTESVQTDEDDATDCGDVVWEDNVFIDYAPELKALEGVTHIQGCLQIQGIDESGLDYLSALKGLRCVDRYVAVNDVEDMKNLKVFSNLHTVGGNLFIQNNESLSDLTGIDNIRNLGGSALYITDNDALPTCTARDLYTEMSDLGWDGDPCIVDNYTDDCDSLSRGCSDEYRW